MMPIWKIRSKIEDMQIDMGAHVKDVNILINSVISMDNDLGLGVYTAESSAEILKVRQAYQYIETVFERYSSTKMNRLLMYKMKIVKMMAKLKQEEKHYSQSNGTGRIIDPDLNMDNIRDWIIYSVESAVLATDVHIHYSELFCNFLDVRIGFCDRVCNNTLDAMKLTEFNGEPSPPTPTNQCSKDNKDLTEPENSNSGYIQSESNPLTLNQLTYPVEKDQRVVKMNRLCVIAVICSICAVSFSSILMPVMGWQF